MKIASLKKRKDFLDIAQNGKKASSKGLLLQVRKRSTSDDYINVGYTATKRLGNAVIRNRIKRRLRALSSEVLTAFANTEYDYVIIGKKASLERDFKDLRKDLKYTLHSTNTHK